MPGLINHRVTESGETKTLRVQGFGSSGAIGSTVVWTRNVLDLNPSPRYGLHGSRRVSQFCGRQPDMCPFGSGCAGREAGDPSLLFFLQEPKTAQIFHTMRFHHIWGFDLI